MLSKSNAKPSSPTAMMLAWMMWWIRSTQGMSLGEIERIIIGFRVSMAFSIKELFKINLSKVMYLNIKYIGLREG